MRLWHGALQHPFAGKDTNGFTKSRLRLRSGPLPGWGGQRCSPGATGLSQEVRGAKGPRKRELYMRVEVVKSFKQDNVARGGIYVHRR